jgi:hypothetical protein
MKGLTKENLVPLRLVKWLRGGLVCKAHRLLYHPTLGMRAMKKRKREMPVELVLEFSAPDRRPPRAVPERIACVEHTQVLNVYTGHEPKSLTES